VDPKLFKGPFWSQLFESEARNRYCVFGSAKGGEEAGLLQLPCSAFFAKWMIFVSGRVENMSMVEL
jgi:hypothetical protein